MKKKAKKTKKKIEKNQIFNLFQKNQLIRNQFNDLPFKKFQSFDQVGNWNDLRNILMLAYSSYCSAPVANLRDFKCFWCRKLNNSIKIEKIFYDSTFDIFGYVASDNYNIYVSFRGTVKTSIKNWIADLSFGHIPYVRCLKCQVHKGFFYAYQSVSSSVLPFLRLLYSNTKKNIIVTGHSLGAALATHFAADLGYENIPANLIHFGGPRVGNQPFADWMDGLANLNTFRVVNQRDIVPHVPPRIDTYYHIRIEIWFQNDTSNYRYCYGGENKNCADSVLGTSISDHLNYLGYFVNDAAAIGC